MTKKADSPWIDGNMFWYSYGSNKKNKKKWKDGDDDEEDEDSNGITKENSNGDLKPKKVTFVGQIEHKYNDSKSSGLIESSVELFKEAKNKVSSKILDCFHDKAPFYADSIKERVVDLLDKLPFYHRPDIQTEVIETALLPQPTVLRPQDLPSQDSDSKIGILVTINNNFQPKKTKSSFFTTLSENMFAKNEKQVSNRQLCLSPSFDQKTSTNSKCEINNHNSLSHETSKFFVFEPLENSKLSETILPSKQPSLLDRVVDKINNVDKNNINNSNNRKFFFNNTFNNNSKEENKHKGYKIKRMRNDKKGILNDPELPKENMSACKKVEKWMNDKENQKELRLEKDSKTFFINYKDTASVNELVKRFEYTPAPNVPSFNTLEKIGQISVKEHIKNLDKILFKEKAQVPQSSRILEPVNRSMQPIHSVPAPPPPPLPPLISSYNEISTNDKMKESLYKNVDKAVNFIKHKECQHEEETFKKIYSLESKNALASGKKTKNFNKKQIKPSRSASAKTLLRDFVKRTFKLKSISPATKKQDFVLNSELVGNISTPHVADIQISLPFNRSKTNETKLESSQSCNIESRVNDQIISENVSEPTESHVTKNQSNSKKCTKREEMIAARTVFFGLPNRHQNISQNNRLLNFPPTLFSHNTNGNSLNENLFKAFHNNITLNEFSILDEESFDNYLFEDNLSRMEKKYGTKFLKKFKKFNENLKKIQLENNGSSFENVQNYPHLFCGSVLEQYTRQKQQLESIQKQKFEQKKLQKQQEELCRQQLEIQKQIQEHKQIEKEQIQQLQRFNQQNETFRKSPLQSTNQQDMLNNQKYITRRYNYKPSKKNYKKNQKKNLIANKPAYQVSSDVFKVFDRVIDQLKDEEHGKISEQKLEEVKTNGQEKKKTNPSKGNEAFDQSEVHQNRVGRDSIIPQIVKSLIRVYEPTK